MSSLVEKC